MSVDKCIDDALTKLSPQRFELMDGEGVTVQTNRSLGKHECQIFAWPQEWDDTSCGQNGSFFGGQMLTKALTVIVIGPMMDACVYHNGEFAYELESMNNEVWDCIKSQSLPAMKDELEQKNAAI